MLEKFKNMMSKKNKNTTPNDGETVTEKEVMEENVKKSGVESPDSEAVDTPNPKEVVDTSEEEKSPMEILEAEKAEAEQQAAELKNKYLRLYAEFENYKKRSIREKLDYMKSASRDTLSALLPIVDDFDRAKKNADIEGSTEQFSDGVTLVYNKFKTILKQKGLTEMETTGTDFDPDLHEAVTEIPAPTEDMKGKVIDTIEKGYMLNDKIIRHAKVVVGK